MRRALPWPPKKVLYKLSALIRGWIDSHASLPQSSHGCKLNTAAWVVELPYLQVVVQPESLFGNHGKARCTVTIEISVRKSNQALFSFLQTEKILSKGPPKQADTAIEGKPCLAMAEFDTQSEKETSFQIFIEG